MHIEHWQERSQLFQISASQSLESAQENVASTEAPGKRAAPWPAAGSAKKTAKVALAPAASKAPLQPSLLSNGANLDHAAQRMGPPPPKKPPTQEQITLAQVEPTTDTAKPAEPHF